FIVRIVREQSIFRIFTTSRQAAIAADEQPKIGITDDAHEERADIVHIGNPIKDFVVDVNLRKLIRRLSNDFALNSDLPFIVKLI
ncbi:MAG: hypothetical protein ACKODM_00545, partial [Cytophagales bacterium]